MVAEYVAGLAAGVVGVALYVSWKVSKASGTVIGSPRNLLWIRRITQELAVDSLLQWWLVVTGNGQPLLLAELKLNFVHLFFSLLQAF